MGLSVEFYAGDAKAIADAFNQSDFDALRSGAAARRYADFSLHLSPTDLDLLSEVLAEHSSRPALALYDCIGPSIGGEPGESDAYLVDPKWVDMIAAADLESAESLTASWIGRVGAELGETLPVTPEAVVAMQNLIALCRFAKAAGTDVVHTWYL
jgi:hypothetical protein